MAADVTVYRLHLDGLARPFARRALLRVLPDAELQHFGRIRHPDRAVEGALTRAALRVLLGGALRRPPRSLVLATSPHGKPFLRDHPRVEFNVSHTTRRALVAISSSLEVGVDVERIDNDIGVEELAAEVFAPATAKALRLLPPGERRAMFFRCWVRGEALAKATGQGLAGGDGVREVSLHRPTRPSGDLQAGGCQLHDLPDEDGCAAALAVRAPGHRRLRVELHDMTG